MIIKYKLFENLQTQKFSIPKQIEQYYIIEGDMSNARNWKSTKSFLSVEYSNNNSRTFEESLGIRYIMISLDSNNIVPICMNDEHRTGYEVLYDVYFKKYKIPKEKYISICSWGETYVYEMDIPKQRENFLQAFKKFVEYGGNPKLNIYFYGTKDSNFKPYRMSIEKFLKTDGTYDSYLSEIVNSGEISDEGKNLINIFDQLSDLLSQYEMMKREVGRTKYIEKEIINYTGDLTDFFFWHHNTYKLVGDIHDKFFSQLSSSKRSNDIDKISWLLFNHDGIKNAFHIKIKESSPDAKILFWNLEKINSEFIRINRKGELN